MSLPFFRSQGTFVAGSGAISPGIPAGIQPNDILVMIVMTPFGPSAPDGTWTQKYTNALPRLSVFWKRTSGSESAPTVSDTGAQQAARIFAFGGCVTTGDPFDTGVQTDVTWDDSDVNVTIPGDTSASANLLDLIITASLASVDPLELDAYVASPSWVNADLANISHVASSDIFYASGSTDRRLTMNLTTAEDAVAGAFTDTVSDPFWAGTFVSLIGVSVVLALIGQAPSYVMDADPVTVDLQIQDLNSLQEGSAGTLDAEYVTVDLQVQVASFFHGGGGVATIDTWQWDTKEVDEDFVPIPWYLAHQYSDAGAESMSKMLSAVRVTGKTTEGEIQIHGAAPGEIISRENVEDGTGAAATFPIADATDVTRHERVKMRVRNMSQVLVRVSGEWDGENGRDRLDEIAVEGGTHGTQK